MKKSKQRKVDQGIRNALLKATAGSLFLFAILRQGGEEALPMHQATIIASIPLLITIWRIIAKRKQRDKEAALILVQEKESERLRANGILYSMIGVNDVLEVYENKLTIAPKTNLSSILIRGLKGTKTIPFKSITAIQFRKANPINGYIQFTLFGGKESTGGVLAAIADENTCFFLERDNILATKIKDYIESKISEK